MSELRQETCSADPSEQGAHGGFSVSPDPPDPLARLHKMSTTAGVASSQYVAINALAITALLFGIASALSLFASVLLVIPVVGVVFALVAIRQVQQSNGTQTGRGLAIIGLVLCVVLGAAVIARQAMASLRTSADTHRIAALIDELGQEVGADRLQQAYTLFSPMFRARISPGTFEARWRSMQGKEALGRVHGMAWNEVPPLYDTVAGGAVPIAITQVKIKSDVPNDDRFRVDFRKVEGQWLIDDIPTFFPEQPAKGK